MKVERERLSSFSAEALWKRRTESWRFKATPGPECPVPEDDAVTRYFASPLIDEPGTETDTTWRIFWDVVTVLVPSLWGDDPLKKYISSQSVEERTSLNSTPVSSHNFSKCSSKTWRCVRGDSRITLWCCFLLLSARWRVPPRTGEGEFLHLLNGSKLESLLDERSLLRSPLTATASCLTGGVDMLTEWISKRIWNSKGTNLAGLVRKNKGRHSPKDKKRHTQSDEFIRYQTPVSRNSKPVELMKQLNS